MNWSKVKTILITLFLITDILLGTAIIVAEHKATSIKPEIIDATVNLLANRGITVSRDIIPTKIPDASYIEAVNSISGYDEFAERINRDNPEKLSDTTYKNKFGILEFSGDTFSYKTFSEKTEFDDIMAKGDYERRAKEMASGYFNSLFNNPTADVSSEKIEYGYRVTFTGKYKSLPIFCSEITMTVTGHNISEVSDSNGVSNMSGSWFTPTGVTTDAGDLKSITGILIDFMAQRDDNEPVEITDLTLGYTVFDSGIYHKSATLVPAWRITLSDGTTYFMDARNPD